MMILNGYRIRCRGYDRQTKGRILRRPGTDRLMQKGNIIIQKYLQKYPHPEIRSSQLNSDIMGILTA